jgi:hypothetical protein
MVAFSSCNDWTGDSTPRQEFCLVPQVCRYKEFLATDLEVRVRFPALPDFLRSSGSGTESTQPREYS